MQLGLTTSISLLKRRNVFVQPFSLSIFSPSNGSTLGIGEVTVNGRVLGATITDLDYRVNDGAWNAITIQQDWSFDVTLGEADTSITVRAIDDQLEERTATINITVEDQEAPTVGDKTLTTSNITDSSFRISFNKATDNESTQADLVYKLYKGDIIDLGVLSTIESQTLVDTQTDVSFFDITGQPSEEISFNVLVEDETGNKTIYTADTETIADKLSAPVIDEQGITNTFTTINLSYSSVTGADSYEYRVDGGTIIDNSTNTSISLTDLQPNTFLIEVRAKNTQSTSDWDSVSVIIADMVEDTQETSVLFNFTV